ncbi:MAG: HEAT repeat domain-containing protein [Candidatus Latescibacterota bacterium]|nr:MAG: HEAT repeat domain-containing protein [Candidatus Latescibacterota bacterium]
MNCQVLRDLIPDYLAAELSRDTFDQFEAHLRVCEGCRVELEQMETVWKTLGDVPDEEPSPGLRSRFYAMLESEKRRITRTDKGSWLTRIETWVASWWPRRPVVQVAVAIAIFVVGLAGGRGLRTGFDRDGELTQLRDEVQQMHETVALSLLSKEASSDRLRGVNWSARVTDPSEALLASLTNTLNSDPNVNVRIAAVEALALFRDEPGVVDALADALARETSPMVQIGLIDLLIVIQEKQALEALRNLIEMQHVIPSVKEHAEHRLSGSL